MAESDFRFVVCDVFTDQPLTGNQLAVFTDARDIPEGALQALAREVNFSETVFVYPADGDAHALIRIFTPASELPFAGHPVLGTAFVLGGPLQAIDLVLETGAGPVPVALEREGSRIIFAWMGQPVPSVTPYDRDDELLGALGVEGSLLPIESYDNGIRHVFVRLGSEAEVAALTPDFAVLSELPQLGTSCFAGAGTMFKTRVFAPGVGVNEDPATGSAAGPLACHLVRHGVVPSGAEIEIRQGAEIDRPSTLFARADADGTSIDHVSVGGSAVIVARGSYRLPPALHS